MVSLNARDSQYRQGGFFLEAQTDDTSGRESMAESISSQHRLLTVDVPEHGFWALPSTWVAGFETLILLTYITGLCVCTFATNGKPDWPESREPNPPFAFFVVMHGIVWAIVAICDRMIQVCHQKVRKRGYLAFYRQNRLLRRMPFVVFSAGNAVLLVLTQLMGCPKTSGDSAGSDWGGTKRTYLLIVSGCFKTHSWVQLLCYMLCSLPNAFLFFQSRIPSIVF